jgi:hypothetical protein
VIEVWRDAWTESGGVRMLLSKWKLFGSVSKVNGTARWSWEELSRVDELMVAGRNSDEAPLEERERCGRCRYGPDGL